MKTSDAQIERTKRQEGYGHALPDGSCQAYSEIINGKADRPTIGWGCTRGVTMGMVKTKAEAEAILRAELAIHEKRIEKIVTVPLNQNQFDALVDFDFNCGGLTLDNGKPSGLLKKLNAGDYDGAAAKFDEWCKFGGKTCGALVRRRTENKAIFLRPAEPVDTSYMPQAAQKPSLVEQYGPTVLKGAAVLGTGGAVGTTATQTATDKVASAAPTARSFPSIPSLPQSVTDTITNVGAIKDTATTVTTFGQEMAANWPLAAVVVVCIAALIWFTKGSANAQSN